MTPVKEINPDIKEIIVQCGFTYPTGDFKSYRMDIGYKAAVRPGEDDSEVFETLKKKVLAVLNEEKQELKRKIESGSDYLEDQEVGFYQDPPFPDDISQCDEDDGF